MNSIKRITLACRAAIAETKPIVFLIPSGIMMVITVLVLLVNADADSNDGVLRSALSFWDPDAIKTIIVFAGWIGSLIVTADIHNRWFKAENQAVRTLSLPLSNGERFTVLLIVYLLVVPLVAFGLPLLLVLLVYPLVPGTIFLPAPLYLLEVLGFGFLVNLITCTLWLQPSFAFGKRNGFVFFAMIGMAVAYVAFTHGATPETLDVPYQMTSVEETQAVGLASYGLLDDSVASNKIKVKYPGEDSVYDVVQLLLVTVMLASAGLALTKKTA